MGFSNNSATPNVTPLIDILLVLLIIFMVISPLDSVGLRAELPAPPHDEGMPAPPTTVVIQIASDLSLRVNQEPVAADRLAARLREIFANRGDRTAFLYAAPDLEFGHVARTIDVTKANFVERVALMNYPR